MSSAARDRRETPDYNGGPHGVCHKGVDGRRVAAPEESAARILSLTENFAMFWLDYGCYAMNTRFRNLHAVATSSYLRINTEV